MDTVATNLRDIAIHCCEQICKYHADYEVKAPYFTDPEEAYERLCIEHCEECPLNNLGVWE